MTWTYPFVYYSSSSTQNTTEHTTHHAQLTTHNTPHQTCHATPNTPWSLSCSDFDHFPRCPRQPVPMYAFHGQARSLFWTASSVAEALLLFGTRKHHHNFSGESTPQSSSVTGAAAPQTAEWIPIIGRVHTEMLERAPSSEPVTSAKAKSQITSWQLPPYLPGLFSSHLLQNLTVLSQMSPCL